ncbi:uncharacterized protein B0I36DRAFT_356252 [Microdochium trichocladiopsis]|uniref:UDP-N-acetylglucosamine transferase subunit ALG13 n=1 Tax=Microdochium trichocladiopsis TaxID=1682393 RepID=A0A9P8XQV2_9PEZI|nr:uncharacterized protein B0I36DRAFT_356252 [Microdochium trichocladiopsis]KAH7012162.1 hypothetical protein B0I36DRAFT_356252 [Microdochium trichocladiopsis]
MASSRLYEDYDIEAKPFLSTQVVVIGASIGSGHTSAGLELQRRLESDGISTEYHDILDALPLLIRIMLRDLYAPLVTFAPSLFSWLMLAWEVESSWMIRLVLWTASDARVLEWIQGKQAIVTTHAIATQIAGSLRVRAEHDIPIASYHCDAGIHPLQLHRSVSMNLVPTRVAAMSCRRYGHDALVIPPLVGPRFRETTPYAACFKLKKSLGLCSTTPIVILAAGSLGIGKVVETVQDIVEELATAQILVLCGKNAKLRKRLRPYLQVVALGWRQDIAEILAISDVMVHNAGGMAIWEAMMSGLPIVTYNALPGHGRANALALEDGGISPWPRDRASLGLALKSVIASGRGKALTACDAPVSRYISEMTSTLIKGVDHRPGRGTADGILLEKAQTYARVGGSTG